MVGSIVVVGALTHYALLHFVGDLKVEHETLSNSGTFALRVRTGVITPRKKPKTFFCVKDEGAVDLSRVTRWLKKICSDYKNLSDHVKSGRPKTMDFKVVL